MFFPLIGDVKKEGEASRLCMRNDDTIIWLQIVTNSIGIGNEGNKIQAV